MRTDVPGQRISPNRLAAAIFVLFVAGVLALGLVLYNHARRAAEQNAEETLRVSALATAYVFNTWLKERAADAEAVGTSDLLQQALDRWQRGGADQDTNAAVIQKHLALIQRLYGYRTVAIIDRNTEKSVFRAGVAPTSGQLAFVARTQAAKSPQWIELSSPDERQLHIGLVQGMADGFGSAALALYMEFDPRWLVNSLEKAQPANWAGETLLVRASASGAQLLSSSTGATLQPLARSYSDMLLGAGLVVDTLRPRVTVSAWQGRKQAGENVMASSERILLPGWIVISELPSATIYATTKKGSEVLLAGSAALILLGSLLYLTWRRGDRLRVFSREADLRQHYEHMLRESADVFLLADEDGTVLDASHGAATVYGYPRERLVGMSIYRLRTPESAAAQAAMWKEMKPGESRQVCLPRQRADGSSFLFEGSLGCFEADGRHHYLSIGRDVTRRAEVDTRLRVAASFFERSAAGIIVADRDRRIVSINSRVTAITGYQLEDLLHQPTTKLSAGLEPAVAERALSILKEEDFWEGEVHIRRKDGAVFLARLFVCAHRGADGEVEQYIDVFTDLTRLKQAEGRAEYLAIHDPATKLPNRAKLEQDLPKYLADVHVQTSPGQSLTLALVNLDRFNAVNESFGYAQGDALLVEVAQRLRGLGTDLKGLYRYGGDEFMLVLPGSLVTHALLISEVRALLAPPIRLGAHPVSPTASIGVASYPDHALTSEDLLLNVESAMRMAKSQGRNTWRLYAPEMNASAYDDMLLAVDLRQAIDAGALQLHLQPQFTLEDGKPVGTEALLRWQHAARGAVSPARFIPIAESSGMMAEIGHWVVREAARIWAQWRSDGLQPLPIAVNLSATQFQAPDFLFEVRRVLTEFDLPAGALEMEITEGILMANTDVAVDTMRQLVSMGIQIAIDDFGTGYSSLSYLRQFPVSKLKIDRSFVLDLGKSGQREAEAITSAVIAMAKSLRLRVIAEGVETTAQRDFLREQGCDEVQGYLYARPMPVEAIKPLLANQSESHQMHHAGSQSV